jgi:hypothetical protein
LAIDIRFEVFNGQLKVVSVMRMCGVLQPAQQAPGGVAT